MSEAFVVAPLDGVDAAAVRSGDDLLVHISSDLPRRARMAAVDHLRQMVCETDGAAAAATLPLGEAIRLANEHRKPETMPLPRSAVLGAVGAGVMFDALCGDMPQPTGLFEMYQTPTPGWLGGLEEQLGLELI